MNTPEMAALERAIGIAGGVTALASAIGAAASAPSMWKKRGKVPAEWCPGIERATGVPCEELRQGVPWEVLRKPAESPLPPLHQDDFPLIRHRTERGSAADPHRGSTSAAAQEA